MSVVTRWCAIADVSRRSDEARYQALSRAMREAGLENEFSFLVTTESELPVIIEKAKAEFRQIRLVGSVGSWLLPLLEKAPSSVVSLKTADALVRGPDAWWPRFYLVEGLNQMFASDAKRLDLQGSIFIFGATSETRAVIAAFSKIGFNKMLVSDPDEAVCTSFVEDLKRSYFGTSFQAVPRSAVTLLPGVCSIAVNTLGGEDLAEAVTELAYFNFLKSGGSWLDLSIYPVNATLRSEATSVGSVIIDGARALAITDGLWAQAVFKISIDIESYTRQLSF